MLKLREIIELLCALALPFVSVSSHWFWFLLGMCIWGFLESIWLLPKEIRNAIRYAIQQYKARKETGEELDEDY